LLELLGGELIRLNVLYQRHCPHEVRVEQQPGLAFRLPPRPHLLLRYFPAFVAPVDGHVDLGIEPPKPHPLLDGLVGGFVEAGSLKGRAVGLPVFSDDLDVAAGHEGRLAYSPCVRLCSFVNSAVHSAHIHHQQALICLPRKRSTAHTAFFRGDTSPGARVPAGLTFETGRDGAHGVFFGLRGGFGAVRAAKL